MTDRQQTQSNTLNGQFLVSMPDLKDGTFNSSVVLLCEHSETGAMGFIVNLVTIDVGNWHRVSSRRVF